LGTAAIVRCKRGNATKCPREGGEREIIALVRKGERGSVYWWIEGGEREREREKEKRRRREGKQKAIETVRDPRGPT